MMEDGEIAFDYNAAIEQVNDELDGIYSAWLKKNDIEDHEALRELVDRAAVQLALSWWV